MQKLSLEQQVVALGFQHYCLGELGLCLAVDNFGLSIPFVHQAFGLALWLLDNVIPFAISL